MTKEEFNQSIKRYQALKEYSEAFQRCLTGILDDRLRDIAYETGKKLLTEHEYRVMRAEGSTRILTPPLTLTMEWIIDTAIAIGYTALERGSIQTGIFSSCPCISIGNLLAKQKFGIRKNKNQCTTLVYAFNPFISDHKLINALCLNILDTLKSGSTPE